MNDEPKIGELVLTPPDPSVGEEVRFTLEVIDDTAGGDFLPEFNNGREESFGGPGTGAIPIPGCLDSEPERHGPWTPPTKNDDPSTISNAYWEYEEPGKYTVNLRFVTGDICADQSDGRSHDPYKSNGTAQMTIAVSP